VGKIGKVAQTVMPAFLATIGLKAMALFPQLISHFHLCLWMKGAKVTTELLISPLVTGCYWIVGYVKL